SITPYPTPGLASCMITLAGPSSSAIPIKVSPSCGVRRGRRPATGGSPTARSTCLIGSLTVIAHLPAANCENACFLILQARGDRCQDGIHGDCPDVQRTALRR